MLFFLLTSLRSPSSQARFVHNLPIHPYLKQGLLALSIPELKGFQLETLTQAQAGRNCFINSCTGSGKTLAYLVPILDQVLKKKDQGFQQEHGAVILTLNKELCLQIYRTIRRLDLESRLSVKRTGPVSHYLPVITELASPPNNPSEADLIDAKINANLVSSIKWDSTDILVSTPQLLYNLTMMAKHRDSAINPDIVAVDQADLLLEIDRNVSRHTYRLLEVITKTRKESKASSGKPIQYLISASSFPKRVGKRDYLQALSDKFPALVPIAGEQQHLIPTDISLYSIEVHKMPNPKLYYLADILANRPNEKVIIFCNNKSSVDEVCAHIQTALGRQALKYHASLDSNERSRVLFRFEGQECDILVATDLASRGLDFSTRVNLIIEYEMAQNITGFLNRVGRTGRNGVGGEVITMVGQEDEGLFGDIKEMVEGGGEVSELFSRKRSYRKLYKE